MQDRQVKIALVVVVAIALLGSGVGIYAAHRSAPPPIIISPPPDAAPSVSQAPPTDPPAATPPVSAVAAPAKPAPPPGYYVHVAGAVKNPSLYTLPPGSRVMQAIKAAGGPRADADLDAVNLAEKVTDGEKIYIPTKSAAPQTTAMIAPPGNSLGHTGVDPSSAATSSGPSAPSKAASSAKSAKTAKGGASKPDKLTSPSQGQVNINTATAEQLQRLPGIGPAMAARILAYRQQAGGFQKIDELQEISGIGPKKYAKIAPLVKL